MGQRIFILGAGRFGTHLATRLSEFGCEVVLADEDPQRVKDLAALGYHIMEFHADDEAALKEAGVAEADVVVVSIGENMQDSILATLILKGLKVKKVIARAMDAKHALVLEKVGADIVILPTRDMAYQLAERLRDSAQSDRVSVSPNHQLTRVKIGPKLDGQSLAEAQLPRLYNINVVLVCRPTKMGQLTTLEPEPTLVLERYDILVIVGRREKINHFERECGA